MPVNHLNHTHFDNIQRCMRVVCIQRVCERESRVSRSAQQQINHILTALMMCPQLAMKCLLPNRQAG